eukprot:8796271-Pyramimonas_sp.AAC.1
MRTVEGKFERTYSAISSQVRTEKGLMGRPDRGSTDRYCATRTSSAQKHKGNAVTARTCRMRHSQLPQSAAAPSPTRGK